MPQELTIELDRSHGALVKCRYYSKHFQGLILNKYQNITSNGMLRVIAWGKSDSIKRKKKITSTTEPERNMFTASAIAFVSSRTFHV